MKNVKLNDNGDGVIILDQAALPAEENYLELKKPEEMYYAIKSLQVRGAPAIGIFAGYSLAALAKSTGANISEIREYGEYLKSSRPTAVNLAWAVDRVVEVAENADDLAEATKLEAIKIHEEDIAMCKAISEHGLTVIKDGDGVLTHCNAGPLATSEYGTALGPLILGTEKGMNFKAFADETRPLLQGARLTTYELNKAGVDVTLICDNMASMVMKNGWVQACFVGCDRVAANGDTANKIGTSGVAILAKHYGVPFYVLGPTSTIDLDCPTGKEIPIEEREPDEIKEKFYNVQVAPEGIKCFNPAFDVTDHELISGIITEMGVLRPPYTESLKAAKEAAKNRSK